jgi:hypothetical protein
MSTADIADARRVRRRTPTTSPASPGRRRGSSRDELVRRMDRVGKWTLHEGDLTIKSSSPAAGTERYDDERLANALTALVEEDVIDAEAARRDRVGRLPAPPEPYWRQKPAGIKSAR